MIYSHPHLRSKPFNPNTRWDFLVSTDEGHTQVISAHDLSVSDKGVWFINSTGDTVAFFKDVTSFKRVGETALSEAEMKARLDEAEAAVGAMRNRLHELSEEARPRGAFGSFAALKRVRGLLDEAIKHL